jgi:hypothetical protein
MDNNFKKQLIKYFISAFMFFAAGVCSSAIASDYIMELEKYATPSISKPALGETVDEINFKTKIKRITDVSTESRADSSTYIRNDYSKYPATNSDGSMIMVRSGGGYLIYRISDQSFIYEGNWSDLAEPRWSHVYPNIIYGHGPFDAKMWTFDVSTLTKTVIHDFNLDYPDVTVKHARTRDEGDCSLDDRYWALSLDTPDNGYWKIIVYDLETDSIISELTPPDSYNFINISPKGNYVIVGYNGYSGDTFSGTTVYKRDFSNAANPLQLLCKSAPHADAALDANGNEIAVYQQNIIKDGITMTDLTTGVHTMLIELTSPIKGIHISGNSFKKPGWVLVTTYGSGWGTAWMEDQIFMLETKENPQIWRVSDSFNSYTGNYNSEAFGTISDDGTKVVWAGNWDDSEGKIDTYIIDLPDNWDRVLSSTLPPIAPKGARVGVSQ